MNENEETHIRELKMAQFGRNPVSFHQGGQISTRSITVDEILLLMYVMGR